MANGTHKALESFQPFGYANKMETGGQVAKE